MAPTDRRTHKNCFAGIKRNASAIEELMPEAGKNSIGLCADCIHHTEQVSSKGSVFIRCLLGENDDRFIKYPRLPVVECGEYDLKSQQNNSEIR
ncbi:MAG TPA: hypothetical protein VFO76_00550 [Candidatus Kapabacteria bacterium]|nr:hypothetical protein [Candidatus Kapabacteria bacterium]